MGRRTSAHKLRTAPFQPNHDTFRQFITEIIACLGIFVCVKYYVLVLLAVFGVRVCLVLHQGLRAASAHIAITAVGL